MSSKINNIMNIQKLTKNIKYSVYFEMAYHFLQFWLFKYKIKINVSL